MPVGPSSLVPSLWDEYLIARGTVRNWRDLGTYNPASRLPSGKPSDHAVNPSYAFDVGGDPAGLERLFQMMTARPGVEYVIYKNKIWSRGKGLHEYTAGGHETHVHVSGVRLSAKQQQAIGAQAALRGGYSIGDLVSDAAGLVGNPVLPGSGALGKIDEIPGVNKIPGVGAVASVADAVTAPADAIRWVAGNWDRVLEVMGGFVLLLVGMLLLGRAVIGSKVPGPVGDLANRAQFGPTVTQARPGTGKQVLYLEEAPRPRATGSSQTDEIPF